MILIAHLRQALSSLWAAQSLCLVLFILLAFGLMGISLAAWRAHRRAKRQLEAVRALQRVFTMAPLNLEEMCRLIYDHCLHLVNAPVLILQTRDRAGTLTTPLVVEHDREVEGLSLPDHVWNYLEAGHHSLLIRDWRRGAPLRPLPVGSEPRSGLYVSVVAEERFYGLIALQSPRPRAFTAADGRSLGLLASQLAMGLHTAQLYEQQRERNVQLLTIAEVSRKVAAILDVQTLFADTVQFVQEALGYYHVCILTLDEAGKRVLLQASSSPRIQARGLELPLGYGLIGHAAQSGEPVLANDVTQDERYVIDAGLDKTRAELAIPLKVEDRILGVLDLQSDRVDAFDADDVAVLQVLADQIAVALEDSRIYAMQQEQAWISTALLQVAEALGQQATLDEILATVTRLATLLTGVDRALLLLWSPDGQTFSIGDGAGFPSAELDALRGLAFEGDRVPLLAQMRLGRMTYRGRAEDLWGHLASLVNRPLPLGELLALPLWAGGQFIGALVVEDEGQEIRGAREAILNGVANDAAMALMNARLGAAQREEAWVSTALLQVANVVVRATTNLEETLATVARLTPMLVGIDWCAILLWDEERRAFYCAAAEGQTPNRADMLQGRYLWPEDSPLLADMRNEPGPVVGFCTLESASLRDAMAPYEAQAPVTAFPLRVHERLLGALLAGHDRDCAEIPARRMSILAGIANQTTLAIETAQLYRQSLRQERLRREMELARSIQQSFLPARCPEIPGWDIESEWRAAGEVGGDFYDLVPLPGGRLGIAIADVSDKGVGAALYMALSRTVMRTVAREGYGPAETLRRVNAILMEDASSGMFVSLFYGVVELETGRLAYARAGHNPPLYVSAVPGASPRALDIPGVVLGVWPDPELQEGALEIRPGDALILYTDGLTEALSGAGEEFGEERLAAIVAEAAGRPAAEMIRIVDAAVRRFVGERAPSDDYTLLVLKRREP